jgi:two-component system, cell cycle sensor histidine kinase and response regulator CckA
MRTSGCKVVTLDFVGPDGSLGKARRHRRSAFAGGRSRVVTIERARNLFGILALSLWPAVVSGGESRTTELAWHVASLPMISPLGWAGVAVGVAGAGIALWQWVLRQEMERRVEKGPGTPTMNVGSGGAAALTRGETQLRKVNAEERYRSFVKHSTEGIYCIDAAEPVPIELPPAEQSRRFLERAVLVDCNDVFARMYGYASAADMIGKPVRELLIADDPVNVSMISRFITNGYRIVDAESRERDVGGNQVYFSNSMTGIVDNGAVLRVWGTQRDMSERRRMTMELEESRARYRAITEQLPGLVYVYTLTDAGVGTTDFIAPGPSRLAEALEGVEWGSDWTGFFARIPPEDVEEFNRRGARAVKERTDFAVEFRLRHKDGTLRWMRAISKVEPIEGGQRWYGFISDIHDEKAATHALLESERRLAAMIENSPSVAIQGFDGEGRVVFWNKAAERMYGWTEQEARGRSMGDLIFTKQEFEHFKTVIEGLKHGGPPHGPSEWMVRSRDGTERWAYSTVFALPVSGSKPLYVCMDVDVTERRALEEQLRQGQKMESLGLLAGGIAHDFNNVLAAIRGNAELALGRYIVDNEVKQSLVAIDQAVVRGAELTRQLLAYAGKGKRVVESVDLAQLVREMSELVRVTVGRSAMLRLELRPDLPVIQADPTQVRQVIMNLLTNAAEASSAGSEITVRTSRAAAYDDEALDDVMLLRPSADAPDGFVVLEVADKGSGMNAEALLRVFEPFYTTKSGTRPGQDATRGLGLSVTMGIVKGHGGGIRVWSRPGVGTRFRIFFPVSGAGGWSGVSGVGQEDMARAATK